MRVTTQEKFIAKARTIHGEKYDYSRVVYTKTHDLVTIICPQHGEFEQQPHNHLLGAGCPMCGYIKRRQKMLGTHRRKKVDDA